MGGLFSTPEGPPTPVRQILNYFSPTRKRLSDRAVESPMPVKIQRSQEVQDDEESDEVKKEVIDEYFHVEEDRETMHAEDNFEESAQKNCSDGENEVNEDTFVAVSEKVEKKQEDGIGKDSNAPENGEGEEERQESNRSDDGSDSSSVNVPDGPFNDF